MSAQPQAILAFRPMRLEDLPRVAAIEDDIYAYPWTYGNLRDSLTAQHDCWLYACRDEIAGYAVMMIAGDEAHLLNLTISRPWQRQGIGGSLLLRLMQIARQRRSETFFLEVRPSNTPAKRLYERFGFKLIGTRRNYYPAPGGREDALIMSRAL